MNKICFFNLSTYSTVGGIENFNKSMLKTFDSLNYKVTSISVYDKESDNSFNNIEFKNFKTKKIKASLYLFKKIYLVEKLFVAHINLLPIVIIAKILNPKLKIYITIYGIEVWKKLPYIYQLFLNKINILSISTYTTNTFIKYNKIKNGNIFYLPPDTSFEIEEQFSNNYNECDFNILSVTRLDRNDSYKGIDSMIRSIPLLIKSIPNLKYTIIGKGNDKERLKNLSNELNVEKYIDFKGFVECIEPYYQYCDIFTLPSSGEGFGIVYLEAMKYKKPCIASNEGGQTDVVLDNKTGFLCEYNNTECLSNRIIKLYQNEEKRNSFGKNGYKHLLENFTFDKFKNRVKNILK